eukprot:TRINITY_DN1602_c0_g1_i1.p1 TRINITY_DN1602_c0_g1~~TRINITY_DN1602_c0_g1_i1.p1  ORF type:complete len:386 (+),score=102.47 TRINITY_DN1602_c0_g1_i1:112-1269(+)
MPTIRDTGKSFADNGTQINEDVLFNRYNMDGYGENNYELEAQWRRSLEQERVLALELSNRRLVQENEQLKNDIRLLSLAKRKAEAELDGERENSRIVLEDMGKLFNYIALLETQVFHYKPKEQEKKPVKGKDKNLKPGTQTAPPVSMNRRTRSKILARPTPSLARFSPLYQQLQEEMEESLEDESLENSPLVQPEKPTKVQPSPIFSSLSQPQTTTLSSNSQKLIPPRHPITRRLAGTAPLPLIDDIGKRKRAKTTESNGNTIIVNSTSGPLNGTTTSTSNPGNAIAWVDVVSQALKTIGDQASSREITEKVLEINPALKAFKTLNQQIVTTLSSSGHFEKKLQQVPNQNTRLVWTISSENNNNNNNNVNNNLTLPSVNQVTATV